MATGRALAGTRSRARKHGGDGGGVWLVLGALFVVGMLVGVLLHRRRGKS